MKVMMRKKKKNSTNCCILNLIGITELCIHTMLWNFQHLRERAGRRIFQRIPLRKVNSN